MVDSPYNFDCDEYEYDGGDCNLECNTAVYWETDFAELPSAFYQVDCTAVSPEAETNWESACQCYEFCSSFASSL